MGSKTTGRGKLVLNADYRIQLQTIFIFTTMKCRVLLVFVLTTANIQAQNLVSNPSFEELNYCPDSFDDIEAATAWQSFRLTPDCFNECSDHLGAGVPTNHFSESCFPVEGSGYGGFGMISIPSGFSEVLAVELLDELEVGQEYYVRFYVRRGIPPNNNCWTDHIGAKFTMTEYQDWPQEVTMPITNEAHVLYEGQVSESENWVLVDGYFTADSAYAYLAIGNQFDLDSLNISCDQSYSNYIVYYFVDAVCVSVDPEDCQNFVGIEESSPKRSVQVFPNPVRSVLEIESQSHSIRSISIYEASGRIVRIQEINGRSNCKLNVQNLNQGLYIIMVEFEDGISETQRIIKIK